MDGAQGKGRRITIERARGKGRARTARVDRGR